MDVTVSPHMESTNDGEMLSSVVLTRAVLSDAHMHV